MNKRQATKLAKRSIEVVTVDEPELVADTTVLHVNADGSYDVEDNGEGVHCLTTDEAIRIMVENLTQNPTPAAH